MPPAALTIWGNLEDGFGLNDGDDLKMFIHDSSSGNNYSVENIWNEQGYFISGDLGYVNNALYQTISMSTEIYNEGFNARFGLDISPKSKFKDSYQITSANMVIAIPDNSEDFSSLFNNTMSLTVWEDDIYRKKIEWFIFYIEVLGHKYEYTSDLDITDEYYIIVGSSSPIYDNKLSYFKSMFNEAKLFSFTIWIF